MWQLDTINFFKKAWRCYFEKLKDATPFTFIWKASKLLVS